MRLHLYVEAAIQRGSIRAQDAWLDDPKETP
jgi:hypothetical protein